MLCDLRNQRYTDSTLYQSDRTYLDATIVRNEIIPAALSWKITSFIRGAIL